MAGLAALMTRKKRDRRRELELKLNKQETGSITEIRLPVCIYNLMKMQISVSVFMS
jgi:hypothetical protein